MNKLPAWYSRAEFPILEVQLLPESGYTHLLCAKRPEGVRYSLGCVKHVELRNPFRDRTMKTTFDAVVKCYNERHPDIWRPYAAGGTWNDRPGNAWAGNFWRGYDGNGSKAWDAYSRRTPGYACFRAGQLVRKVEG